MALPIGIIGCGGIAHAKHLPILSKFDDVQIVALCDAASKQRAICAAEEFHLQGAHVYQDYHDLLNDASVDVVHVCTPNRTHAEISIAALRAGKHVMCEKPMATTIEEANAMLQAQHESGKKLTICANNRFRRDTWHLKKQITEGVLGDIYYAKAYAVRRRGVPTWGAFLDKDLQGGGPVIDIGIHAMDLALWLMQNYAPREVFAKTYNRIGKQGSPANPYGNWDPDRYFVEDFGVGMVTMENGATILLEASWALNTLDEKEASVTLCGTKGGASTKEGELIINGEHDGLLYTNVIDLAPKGIPFYPAKQIEGPELELRMWIDALQNDHDPVVLPEQMLTASKVIAAIYASAETGEVVHML